MIADDWTRILGHDPAALAAALRETHHAIHLVAAAGEAFAPHRADGSHRAMTWEHETRRFVGEPFEGAYPFRISLAPGDLRLALLERSGEALGDLTLPGRSLAEAYEWLGKAATVYLGRPFGVVPPPDFAIEGHAVNGRRFAETTDADRSAVASLFEVSAGLLESLAERLGAAAAVRCWAHDFDLSIRLPAPAEGGVPAQSVGVGMASAGGDDPWYWYVDAWPRLEVGGLPPLTGPGRWHQAAWTGAILHAHEVSGMDGGAPAGVQAFLDEAVAAVRGALGHSES